MSVGIIEFAAMIDMSLSALTKAWVVTTIASGLLAAALATAQVWNTAVYLHTLPHVLQLVGDGPPPIIDRWN
jgi:hypothetical protein